MNLLAIILIIFFNKKNLAYGVNNNWIEVRKSSSGTKYLDRDSLNNKGKGTIEIVTKYLKLDTKTSKVIKENIYEMKINCLTNEFKDISVNGKKKLSAN